MDIVPQYRPRILGCEIKSRHSLSIQHLRAAALFANHTKDIERSTNTSKFDDLLCSQHESYATASVLSIGCFLEAMANETLLDAVDDKESLAPLSPQVIANIAQKASILLDKSVLTKYQTILKIASISRFDQNIRPYKDVDMVLNLRNRLVHYEPIWYNPNDPTTCKLEDLENKFPLNPFMVNAQNPFFPDKCLGFGCNKWAIERAIEFTDLFCDKLGIRKKYTHILHEIELYLQ